MQFQHIGNSQTSIAYRTITRTGGPWKSRSSYYRIHAADTVQLQHIGDSQVCRPDCQDVRGQVHSYNYATRICDEPGAVRIETHTCTVRKVVSCIRANR